MTVFTGFEKPKANYFKVPNSFWNIEDLTIHEKFVLLYILRHTWGYQEFDITKRITVDEFQNGRKEKDGSRMDKGCGVSRGAISNALKKLESLEYILVETDGSDAGRIKKSYMLNMAKGSVHHMNAEFIEDTQRSPDSTQRSSDRPRTEKETKKETKEKNIIPLPVQDDTSQETEVDTKAARQIINVYKSYSKNKDPKMFGWALDDAKTLVESGIVPDDIKRWYQERSQDEWVQSTLNGIPTWNMFVKEVISHRDNYREKQRQFEIMRRNQRLPVNIDLLETG